MTTAAELNNHRIGVDLKHMLLSDAFIVGYYNFIEGVAFETFGDTKFKLNPHLRSKLVGAQSVYETGRLFGAVGAMLGFGRIDWFYKNRQVHPDVMVVWNEIRRQGLINDVFVNPRKKKQQLAI
jgi:hypothetical protein